jgi:ABC-2 type transport system permease protein
MQSPPKGVIYDQGYRHYEGVYHGRGHALWTIIWADLQRTLGIKKSWKYKVGLAVLIGLTVITALFLAFLTFLSSNLQLLQAELRVFLSAFYDLTNNWLLILSAMIASDLLCNDRRHRVLPLYLARPIQRYDYLLTKVASIVGFLLMTSLVPALSIILTRTFLSDNAIQFLSTHLFDLAATLLSSLLFALFFGLWAMAVSALTVSRGYAIGATIGTVMLSGLISMPLYFATHNDYLMLINFSGIPTGLKNALYGSTFKEWAELFGGRIEPSLPQLDPWVYALAYVAFLGACASVVYAVYRREGL